MNAASREIKKILCPIALAEVSFPIIRYADFLAQRFGSEVHLLNVVRDLREQETMVFQYAYVNIDKIAAAEREKLEELYGKVSSGLSGKFKLVQKTGYASDEIIKYVKSEEGIDLVVMGTHGSRTMDEIVFGSVANRVVRRCPVPVVIVNPFTLELKV